MYNLLKNAENLHLTQSNSKCILFFRRGLWFFIKLSTMKTNNKLNHSDTTQLSNLKIQMTACKSTFLKIIDTISFQRSAGRFLFTLHWNLFVCLHKIPDSNLTGQKKGILRGPIPGGLNPQVVQWGWVFFGSTKTQKLPRKNPLAGTYPIHIIHYQMKK